FLERAARAKCHAIERIFGEADRKAGDPRNDRVDPVEKRTAAGHDDALIEDVRRDFGRRALERATDRGNDLCYRSTERLGEVGSRDRHLAGYSPHGIAPSHGDRDVLAVGKSRAGILLHPLRRRLADMQVMATAY